MATGEIETEGKVVVLKRVHVAYTLAVDDDADRETIERAHEVHVQGCPVYRSIHPQIHCTTSLELTDAA